MACCPPNFATFHLCGSKRETLEELLVCPPLWPEFAQYPHLWEWGDGRTLGEGSRSAGSPTLCCTSPGARPLAHSWLLRWPYPPRFWTGCILGSKDLCFHQPLPAAPHPAPGLVTDSILVASVLICLPGPWVGGRSWQLDCVPSLEPPPHLSSRRASLPIDSSVSHAPSPFISIPLSLPAQLAPDSGFSLLLSSRLWAAAPHFLSPSPAPGVWGGVRGRIGPWFLPLVSGLGHHSCGSRGRPGPQNRHPEARQHSSRHTPPHTSSGCVAGRGAKCCCQRLSGLAVPPPWLRQASTGGGQAARVRDRQLTHMGRWDGVMGSLLPTLSHGGRRGSWTPGGAGERAGSP